VAARSVVNDATYSLPQFENPPELAAALKSSGPNTHDRTDVSYMRPLKVREPQEA
jgi:hypothetical protein